MNTATNYDTKKEVMEALRNKETIMVFQPGMITYSKRSGKVHLEGPHDPELTTWHAEGWTEKGRLVRII
jgi:hypothetical protein